MWAPGCLLGVLALLSVAPNRSGETPSDTERTHLSDARLLSRSPNLKEKKPKPLDQPAVLPAKEKKHVQANEKKKKKKKNTKFAADYELICNTTIASLKKTVTNQEFQVIKLHQDLVRVNHSYQEILNRLNEEQFDMKQVQEENKNNHFALQNDSDKIRSLEMKLRECRKENVSCSVTKGELKAERLRTQSLLKQLESVKKADQNSPSTQETGEIADLHEKLKTAIVQRETCQKSLKQNEAEFNKLANLFTDHEKKIEQLQKIREINEDTIRQLLATIPDKTPTKPAYLGEACHSNNKVCVEGLACDPNNVCVPVCNKRLPPHVANAWVRWTKSGSGHSGVISCNANFVYTGSDKMTLVCDMDTGQWQTRMEGQCAKVLWEEEEKFIERTVFPLPREPTGKWRMCVVLSWSGAVPPSREAGFSIKLLRKDGSEKFVIDLIRRGNYSLEVSMSENGTSLGSEITKQVNLPDSIKILIDVFKTKTFTITLETSAESIHEIAEFNLEKSPEDNILSGVRQVRVKGELQISEISVWCL